MLTKHENCVDNELPLTALRNCDESDHKSVCVCLYGLFVQCTRRARFCDLAKNERLEATEYLA